MYSKFDQIENSTVIKCTEKFSLYSAVRCTEKVRLMYLLLLNCTEKFRLMYFAAVKWTEEFRLMYFLLLNGLKICD